MKLKFKEQRHQSIAVDALTSCFLGQEQREQEVMQLTAASNELDGDFGAEFRNAPITLSREQILENIRSVQQGAGLPLSTELIATSASPINLDIEMETGTGKTYVYLKSIFELNRKFGWGKFIIVVPSIAIREGVLKSLEITSEHFMDTYGMKARYFSYNSRQLHQLESFASSSGINVMVINIQAFNATGKDNRRIYDVLDEFQSRRPIDVISKLRPFVILDEPQKMEGKKTLDALAEFDPLAVVRYSATHKTNHNKIHRLDAVDAYNQKLVKKIAVRGISVRGLSGTSPYLYLDTIDVSKSLPRAKVEIEEKTSNGIRRTTKSLGVGDRLEESSRGLAQYAGYVVSHIDGHSGTIEFSNGLKVEIGEAVGDVTEDTIRRIQIREAIRAHLEKERFLRPQGIKPLTLFFIDEVSKYRDYSQPDEKGEYARIFEEELGNALRDYLEGPSPLEPEFKSFISNVTPQKVHNGYFSIDRKTSRYVNPEVKTRGEDAGLTDDVSAYDLILKDKERLLSFEEQTSFIFSHSALREGWDNPNVFVMCMLKHSDNSVSRRQEVGRGLRLAVNQNGERIDDPNTVHEINELTVVASESYVDFVGHLQKEMKKALSDRPKQADVDFFVGKRLGQGDQEVFIDEQMAKLIYRYLIKSDYVDDLDQLTPAYFEAKNNHGLGALPESLSMHAEDIFKLIDTVAMSSGMPAISDARREQSISLNSNFSKRAFQELWSKLNRKGSYSVQFDSTELIENAVKALNSELNVPPLQYKVQVGEQRAKITDRHLNQGDMFESTGLRIETDSRSTKTNIKFDLLGSVAASTQLTRKTVAGILSRMDTSKFSMFPSNPEGFISESSRIIGEQKAAAMIQHLEYNLDEQNYNTSIFTAGQVRIDFSKAGSKLKNHIYDYVATDSENEREFAEKLDMAAEIEVFAKLPRGFVIPTPVGDYNPDWAIAFREGSVKHIYFVAETKGSMSSLQLRQVEQAKIACAKKFFERINEDQNGEHIKYGVVSSYEKLMELIAT